MKDVYSKDERNIKYFAVAISVLVITIWALTWTLTDLFFCELGEKGTFGDMFGSVNALFSGLAFVGVIVAILLQRVELKLQREELVQTREELRGQKEQLARQNKTMELQKFESSFFQLLSFHHKLLDAIKYTPQNRELKGAGAIESIYEDFKKHNYSHKPTNELYAEYAFIYSNGLPNYFQNFYNIIKFVDDENVENKEKYIRILKSQLSVSEQVLLFYNCLGIQGSKKHKPLIEKYSLFENMDFTSLLDTRHINQYNLRAFGTTPPPEEPKSSNH